MNEFEGSWNSNIKLFTLEGKLIVNQNRGGNGLRAEWQQFHSTVLFVYQEKVKITQYL